MIRNVLIVHNSYLHLGGEDSVVNNEQKLLSKYGIKTDFYHKNNSEINRFSTLVTAINTRYSYRSKKDFRKFLSKLRPDIVHVHNFFPLLSPSIYDACIEEKVAVVQTLHNYRTVCPGALLTRNGEICENCLKGSPYQSVIYGCYRNSRLATLAVANMVAYHKRKRTWNNKVDCFIALTKFAKMKFIEAGFPENNISVKPNFVWDNLSQNQPLSIDKERKKNALFVGRLSKEKGVMTLLKSWEEVQIDLQIVGAGPLDLNALVDKGKFVHFLGQLDGSSVLKLMKESAFLVMPSEWYEGFPMVLVEAFSQGLPVVGSRLGSMAEIIQDGVTGLHFEAGNAADLAEKVRWMDEHPNEREQMGRNARKVYEENYTPEKNYQILMGIYQKAVESNRGVG